MSNEEFVSIYKSTPIWQFYKHQLIPTTSSCMANICMAFPETRIENEEMEMGNKGMDNHIQIFLKEDEHLSSTCSIIVW